MKEALNRHNVVDLTLGVYRRIYSGFLRGKRINELSLEAEAWFWRVNAIVDDFGNAVADPLLVHADTVGRRRDIDVGQVTSWLREMARVRLILLYQHDGESYLHIAGFTRIQPAGKNGKRIRRAPASPWDNDESLDYSSSCNAAGESGLIQVNPVPTFTQDNDNDNDNDKELAARACPKPQSDSGPKPILVFPTAGKSKTWALVAEVVEGFREAFPGVDVVAECRKALAWIHANPGRKKTANGMRRYLFNWISRSQNSGRFARSNDGRSSNEFIGARREINDFAG